MGNYTGYRTPWSESEKIHGLSTKMSDQTIENEVVRMEGGGRKKEIWKIIVLSY